MPDKINLSSEKERKLLIQVSRHRDEAILAMGDYPQRRAERYQRYLSDPALRPEGPWPDSPKLFTQLTRSILERLQSELWTSLFGTPEAVRLIPFGEEDVEKAKLATRFHRFSLRPPILDFNAISNMAIFEALLDSAAVLRVAPWHPPFNANDEEELFDPELDEFPSEPSGTPQQRALKRFFDTIIRIDLVDQANFLTPPNAQGLQYPEAEYLHQQFYLRPDDLLRMKSRKGFESYDIPDFEEIQRSFKLSERQELEIEREGERAHRGPSEDGPFLFVESYERFVLDEDDGLEEDVIVSWFPEAIGEEEGFAAKGKISRIVKLTDVFPIQGPPKRPFFPITVWPQPRQWKGMNVPDRLETSQDLMNRLHEQMINYGDVSILPFYFYNAVLTGEVPDLRQVRPGEGVPIADIGGVQFVSGRSLNRHFHEQIQLLQGNVERDMNVNDFTQGRSSDRPNAPRTASATLALLQEGRKSFAFQAQHLAGQFEEVLTFHFQLWQDRLPPGRLVPLRTFSPGEEGPPGENDKLSQEDRGALGDFLSRLYDEEDAQLVLAGAISREDLSGIFDVSLQIQPDSAFDQQSLFTIVQALGPILLQTYPMGLRDVWKRLFDSLKQKGFDRVWPESVAQLMTERTLRAMQVEVANLEFQLIQLQLQRQQFEQQMQLQQAQQQAGVPPQLGGGGGGGQPQAQAQPQQNGQAQQGGGGNVEAAKLLASQLMGQAEGVQQGAQLVEGDLA